MDELLLFAVPVALVAVAAAVLKPARERVVPVAKAVGVTGVAVAQVTAAGTRGIVDAAIHGEGKQSGTSSGSTGSTSSTSATTRSSAQRRPTKASAGRTRRRAAKSATS